MSIVMYILESKNAHINLNSFLEVVFVKQKFQKCQSSHLDADELC